MFFWSVGLLRRKWTTSPLEGEAADWRAGWRGIDICDRGGTAGVCNHLMTRCIDPVPSVGRGAQTAYWWWLVQKQTTDCSLTAADADIFIQLAQLTVIKENETLRLVWMGRRGRREEGPRGETTESVQSLSQDFTQTYAEKRTLRYTLCPPPTHTHT